MKKKAKLFTTIASLCLAVALMAFGVYAATTVTGKITSQVSFEAKDVSVTITTKVEGGVFEADSAGAGIAEAAARDKTITVLPTDNTNAVRPVDTLSLGNYTFEPATNKEIITYTITITNTGATSNISIAYTETEIFAAVTGMTATAVHTNDSANVTDTTAAIVVAPGKEYKLIITLSLTDRSADITTQNLDLTYVITKATA